MSPVTSTKRSPATDEFATTHASISDHERAAAYHVLLTGFRDLSGYTKIECPVIIPPPSAGEMLAALHRYLLKSKPIVPVKVYISDMLTKEFINILSNAEFMDEERAWLWDNLIGDGIVTESSDYSGPRCGLPLLRFYSLLAAAGSQYPGVVLPSYLVFYLMAWCSETDLFSWKKTATAWVISTTNESLRVLNLQGSVRVPFRYFPADSGTPDDESPFDRISDTIKQIFLEKHKLII